jgi:hypothetical protein
MSTQFLQPIRVDMGDGSGIEPGSLDVFGGNNPFPAFLEKA